MKNIRLALLTTALAMAGISTIARAEVPLTANPAYLLDEEANAVTSGFGECWRTGEWTKELATAPCDPVPKPAPVAIAVPEPAPAPPPAPEPEAAPIIIPVPMPQKISFSGDALFAFDQVALRPESRTLLDDLAQKLQGANAVMLSVTGHTDRLGPPAYNQRLSERRAQAVKDYLVGKNIAAERIEAKGVGETQPVTAAADCKGNRATAKLIACLQPDRRVDVEMSGTKTPEPSGATKANGANGTNGTTKGNGTNGTNGTPPTTPSSAPAQ